VTLDKRDQTNEVFYQESGMHGSDIPSIEAWLQDTAWDDDRRFAMVKATLRNKRLLDFGCGAAGFLQRAQTLAAEVTGIELETRVRDYWEGKISVVPSLEAAGGGFDLITAFHVIEHLHDPRATISRLAAALTPNGRMILEVPSANDALLTLYDCDAFQCFTYWSQHLFLFNAATLGTLARQAGLRVAAVQHYQRYPLSNHLHWLSHGKPGGHQRWAFLDTPELTAAYASSLAAMGRTDTLIAHLEHFD
jgi:2-polyprenyl-3-methyl-5-hydroxy-6-metoxy-1,4-benzoquinol methylase